MCEEVAQFLEINEIKCVLSVEAILEQVSLNAGFPHFFIIHIFGTVYFLLYFQMGSNLYIYIIDV